MQRATTTERSRPMKRTNNGILIPDVPIMAGGNLPNAVKGVGMSGTNWRKMGAKLQSDGKQWIDTLIFPLVTDDFYIDFAFTEYVGARTAIFGVDVAGAASYIGEDVIYWGGEEYRKIEGFTEHVIEKKGADWKIDNVAIPFTPSQKEYQNHMKWSLFRSMANQPDIQTAPSIAWIKSFVLTRNGVTLREMYPAIDKDGVACFYDYVSESFFYNQGTGEFLYVK